MKQDAQLAVELFSLDLLVSFSLSLSLYLSVSL
jgi:hypothetical protein